MKKIILLLFMTIVMATPVFSGKRAVPLRTHQNGEDSEELIKEDRNPLNLPIAVFHDSDTNILEVWCDDDNIRAEVFVYDETGDEEAYSPYLNVALQLTSPLTHSILIKGDGWEAVSEVIN